MSDELLVVKKKGEKVKFKVTDRQFNRWTPSKYEKIIANRDYNLLAFLFYDLYKMGYNIEKAYHKFKEFENDPELFFLR